MTTNELASKLSQRLQIEGKGSEVTEQPGLNRVVVVAGALMRPAPTVQHQAAVAMVLNQGIGKPWSPSCHISNP